MRLASAVGALAIGLLLAAPAMAGEIHHYASTGKAAQVEALLRAGVSPDKPDEEGRTPARAAGRTFTSRPAPSGSR